MKGRFTNWVKVIDPYSRLPVFTRARVSYGTIQIQTRTEEPEEYTKQQNRRKPTTIKIKWLQNRNT